MAIKQLDRINQDLRILRKLLRSAAESSVGQLRQREVEISRGIPLYRLQSPAGPQVDLATAQLQAWRYLVFERQGGRALLVAEVEDREAGERNERTAAIVGSAEAATQLLEQLSAVETLAAGEECELRLIEIPQADEEAAWLHGSRDRFIDIIRPGSGEPENSEQFLGRVRAILELRSRPENVNAHEMTGEAL